ncbi:hypothetical protein EJB05_00864, partial [Eragrostis curvula]
MLRWICGHTRRDRVRNDYIRERLGVAPTEKKIIQYRLRWLYMCNEDQRRRLYVVGFQCPENVKRGRGRPTLTWAETGFISAYPNLLGRKGFVVVVRKKERLDSSSMWNPAPKQTFVNIRNEEEKVMVQYASINIETMVMHTFLVMDGGS